MAATTSSDISYQGHNLPAVEEMATSLSSPSPPPEKLSVDDMLKKYCGEFGRWQVRQFVLANLAWSLEAFHAMVMIFADHEPEWRCIPGSASSGCKIAAVAAAGMCHLEPGLWEWVGGTGRSTVSEWGLICGNKFKVGLVQALFFFASAIGAGIFGHLSDSFLGRKGSLIVTCILNAIFGCLTALSPKYWTYVIFRIVTGFSIGGVGINAFALATEPVGPTKRGVVGLSTFYFFSSGTALLSGIAYIFQKWRHLYIASSIPSILFVVFVVPFLSESPRWYLVRGEVTKAMKLMSTIASTNGKHLPSGVILALDQEASFLPNDGKEASFTPKDNKEVSFVSNDDKEASFTPKDNKEVSFVSNDDKEASHIPNEQTYKKESIENKDAIVGSILDVLKSPVTRIRLFIAVALSFFVSFVYYGLTLNVVNLRINLYMNVALNSMAELPAFLTTSLLLDRFGRKGLAMGTMWFSGFFCLMGSLIKNVGIWKVVRMLCGILGIFGMAGTINLIFIYIAELFPTVVRNVALGCSTQAQQMGAILAPFVVVLGGLLPFAVFGACGILGGVFVFFLPETMNQPLYDTIAGLEAGNV